MNLNYILQSMMQNNALNSNVVFQNALELYKRGDSTALHQLAENVCKNSGQNYNDLRNKFTNGR